VSDHTWTNPIEPRDDEREALERMRRRDSEMAQARMEALGAFLVLVFIALAASVPVLNFLTSGGAR
jgi:uncharacterized MAPEG superfamily protein